MNNRQAEIVREQHVRLERATSPSHEDTSHLDEKTSGLRDSWLGLVALVNASDKELNVRPLPELDLPSRQRNHRIAVGLLACSALVFFAFGWNYWPGTNPRMSLALNSHSFTPDSVSLPHPASSLLSSSGNVTPLETLSVAPQFTWDDEWDEHATLAREEFARMNSGSSWLDESFRSLSYRLDLIHEELNVESL